MKFINIKNELPPLGQLIVKRTYATSHGYVNLGESSNDKNTLYFIGCYYLNSYKERDFITIKMFFGEGNIKEEYWKIFPKFNDVNEIDIPIAQSVIIKFEATPKYNNDNNFVSMNLMQYTRINEETYQKNKKYILGWIDYAEIIKDE